MRQPRGPNLVHQLRRDERWHELFWLFIHAEWSVEDIAVAFGLPVAVVREIADEELLADHEWLMMREGRAA